MAITYSRYYRGNIPQPMGSQNSLSPILDFGTPAGTGTILLGATGDTIRICTLGERQTLGANWALIAGDHDTGAGLVLTLQANNGTTTMPIIHQSTVGQAGGIARPGKIVTTETGVGFTVNSKLWWLELLIATQAAGAQAARLLLQMDISGFYPAGAIVE